jgi:hypothetical protein
VNPRQHAGLPPRWMGMRITLPLGSRTGVVPDGRVT